MNGPVREKSGGKKTTTTTTKPTEGIQASEETDKKEERGINTFLKK